MELGEPLNRWHWNMISENEYLAITTTYIRVTVISEISKGNRPNMRPIREEVEVSIWN
jgi:hypothetical protein